jgi:hypothetical protein
MIGGNGSGFAECAEYGGTFSRSRPTSLIPDRCSVFPLVEPGGWEGRIEMGEVTSIHGKWVGENPRVTLENQGDVSVDGTSRTGMWGETLGQPMVGERIKTRPIWIRAQIPSPGPETLHTLVPARVDLDLISPQGAGYQAFRNQNQDRSRTLEFFVVTPHEMNLLEAGGRFTPLPNALFGLIIGLAFLAMGVYAGWVAVGWERQLRKEGFIFVPRLD